MNASRARMLRCELKAVNRKRLSLSGVFLVLSFFVLPIDAYLGSQGLSFVTIGILVLFMISRVVECFIKSRPIKFKLNIVVAYMVYNIILVGNGMLKIGLSYNNLLFLSMVCFFIVFACWPATEKEIQTIASASVLQMVVFILICVRYATVSGGSIYMGIRDMVDPNYLVTNSLLMIVFFLYKFQQTIRNSVIYAIVQAIILCAYIGCIVFIGSRGGLLTVCAVMIVYMLLQTRKPLRTFIVLVVIGIIGVIVFFNAVPSYITERFTLEHILQDGGSGRLTIWSNYLSYYADQMPSFWIFGAGRDVPPTEIYLVEFGREYYSHNLFIKALMEGGVIGIALLIGSMVYLLRNGIKNKNGLFVAALIAFVVGAMFLDLDNMRIFYIIAAFGVSLSRANMRVWKGNISLRSAVK